MPRTSPPPPEASLPVLLVAALAGGLALAPTPLAAGLHGSPSTRIQDTFGAGYEGLALDGDRLGAALAVGDFDGDGFDDLALSDRESLTDENEGAVRVVYGSQNRLGPAGNALFKDYDPSTGESDREIGDGFGSALAAGDFNQDGFDDLAIGIPFEDIQFLADAGEILVLFGSPAGLSTAGPPVAQRFGKPDLYQNVPGLPPEWAANHLGASLAAGDLDGDGFDDLAIGIPESSVWNGGYVAAGQFATLYGSAGGLVVRLFYIAYSQSGDDVPNAPEAGDGFGAALAIGDFDDDGFADVATGAPGEDLGGVADAGAVHVFYGAATGLEIDGNQFWEEANVATGGDRASGDRFGWTLAAGDVTGEGIDDLAIGAPFEDVGAFVDAGAVTLLWGQPVVGLDTPGSELYHQNNLGDGESPGNFEGFGFALAIGDFVEQNARGARDLAIGIPGEEVFDPASGISLSGAGSVTIVPGGFGLDPASAAIWFQGWRGSAGAEDLAENQSYGHALAGGDFDGDGHDDLAVGAPRVDGETVPGNAGVDSGAAYVLHGSLFADNLESGTPFWWSDVVP